MLNLSDLNNKLHKASTETVQAPHVSKKQNVTAKTDDDKRKSLAEKRIDDYINEYENYNDIPVKTLDRIRDCDDYANFLATHDKNHKVLKKAMFCGGRFCPICEHRRSESTYLKLTTIMKAMVDKALKRGHKIDFIFGTFTIPNTSIKPEAVKKEVQLLHKSFLKMMKYKKYNGSMIKGTRKRNKGVVLGGFTKIEITTNYARKNPYHIHLHALMAVRSSYFKSRYYIKQDTWRKDWERATKLNRFLSVKIEHCYYKDKKGAKHTFANTPLKKIPKVISKATEEVAKYPTKAPAEHNKAIANKKHKGNKGNKRGNGKPKHSRTEIFHGLYAGLQNQRLYTYFGDFKKLSKDYGSGKLEYLMPQNPFTFTQEDNEAWKLAKGRYSKQYAPLTEEDIRFCKNHNLKFETPKQRKTARENKARRNRIALNLTKTNRNITKLYECSPKAIKKANRIINESIRKQKIQVDLTKKKAKIQDIKDRAKEDKAQKNYEKKMKSKYDSLIGLIGNAPL